MTRPDDAPPPDTVLFNAHIVDPESGGERRRGSLLIRDGVVADLSDDADPKTAPSHRRIDCRGALVLPGAVDSQAFIDETAAGRLENLADAAVAGGVSSVIVAPDAAGAIDDITLVDFIQRRARDTTPIHIGVIAALTRGAQGRNMSEIGLLSEAGAVAFGDGDRAVADAALLYRIMRYAAAFDALIVQPPLEPSLAEGGAAHAGRIAFRLGLPSIPDFAETLLLQRDLRLVAATGVRYHSAGIASAEAVKLIARAKQDGLPVSCAVSAHHLCLNENAIGNYRTFMKLSPPLRSEDDRQALIAGVNDGTIDCIMSDHRPRDPETKRLPFAQAAFGAVGLETLISQTLGQDPPWGDDLNPMRAAAALTCNPARIFGLSNRAGNLRRGAPADLMIFDRRRQWRVDPDAMRSKAKNTPLEGRLLKGRVRLTMIGGRIVFADPPEDASGDDAPT